MHIIKKIYCRAFQIVFRVALPVLPYREPKLLDSTDALPGLLKEKNISSVLLVTDPGIRGHGLTAPLEAALSRENIHCAVYDRTVANPTTANVEEAREIYLRRDCHAIIGFGGGSSIDCAKAVGARIARPKKSLEKMKGILKVMHPLPLLIAMPTTAGTGSETTLASVITDSQTRHKYPINDFFLIPRYAVLDPEVTRSLPGSVTATTGVDALTHAVEAYIGRSTTRETRAEAVEAVQLIFANLEQAWEHGQDLTARRNMLRAAYLAGCAFTKSYVGYVHAVAHSLGGCYNIPHGLANAVLLPYVLEDYGESIHKKLHRLACAAGLAGEADTDAAAAEKFIAAIRALNRRMGIPEHLSGIQEADIPRLARYADQEANPLYPVPKLMDAKQLEKYYYLVMERAE